MYGVGIPTACCERLGSQRPGTVLSKGTPSGTNASSPPPLPLGEERVDNEGRRRRSWDGMGETETATGTAVDP